MASTIGMNNMLAYLHLGSPEVMSMTSDEWLNGGTRKRIDHRTRQRMRRLHERGLSCAKIAEMIGFSPAAVQRHLKAMEIGVPAWKVYGAGR